MTRQFKSMKQKSTVIAIIRLMQEFTNFFDWRPLNFSEKSWTLKGSYDPINVKNPDFCHVFCNVSQFFLAIKFGDPFLTIGNPQKGRDPYSLRALS